MNSGLLRELTSVIRRPLLIIFERLWQLVKVSEEGKKANVSSIFKKGKKKDLGNYRLLYLSSVPGKVMEKITWKLLPNILQSSR